MTVQIICQTSEEGSMQQFLWESKVSVLWFYVSFLWYMVKPFQALHPTLYAISAFFQKLHHLHQIVRHPVLLLSSIFLKDMQQNISNLPDWLSGPDFQCLQHWLSTSITFILHCFFAYHPLLCQCFSNTSLCLRLLTSDRTFDDTSHSLIWFTAYAHRQCHIISDPDRVPGSFW